MAELNFNMNEYQDEYVFSEARFPCLITGVGTGKTLALLLQCWNHCQNNKNAVAMIIRKEFTDLRDSTMADFTRYFGVKVNGNNDYHFANGSKIMFRHGNLNDLAVLKNVNLSYGGIEQGEEYESAEVFNWLRQRVRKEGPQLNQISIIANANGMNWLWDLFVKQAQTVKNYSKPINIFGEPFDTGEMYYQKSEKVGDKSQRYECWTANSFVNAHNLPDETLVDWISMRENAPNHYKRMILNSFEEIDDDDTLLTSEQIQRAINQEFLYDKSLYNHRIMGVDIARYGKDSSDVCLIQQVGPMHWDEVFYESWNNHDLDYTTGRIMNIRGRMNPDVTVVDGEGMGGGPVDQMRANGVQIVEYRGGMVDNLKKPETYADHNAEDAFRFKDFVDQGRIRIKPELMAQLQTVRYKYNARGGKKRMVSKEEMRTKGIASPNHFDAIKMACSQIESVKVNAVTTRRQPRMAKRRSPFANMR